MLAIVPQMFCAQYALIPGFQRDRILRRQSDVFNGDVHVLIKKKIRAMERENLSTKTFAGRNTGAQYPAGIFLANPVKLWRSTAANGPSLAALGQTTFQ